MILYFISSINLLYDELFSLTKFIWVSFPLSLLYSGIYILPIGTKIKLARQFIPFSSAGDEYMDRVTGVQTLPPHYVLI
jgi:hypothetical protein